MLRKSFAFFTIGFLVLAVTASSFGALLGTATLVKEPPGSAFGAPDAALGAPWVSYILSVKGNAGEVIQAAEANILGQLHQRWTDADGDEVFEATGNSSAASGLTNGDTHLLAPAGALFGSGPTEDNPGTGSPLTSTGTARYGVGTMLQGAFALTTATAPNGSLNVAYLVVPKNAIPQLNLTIKAADPTGAALGTLTLADFPELGGTPPAVPVVTPFTDTADILNEVITTTLQATNGPITSWSALTGFMYTPGFGALPGAPGIGTAPTFNTTTGQFSFNTAGSTRGTYKWNVTATNAAGVSAPAMISIDVTAVPEPATLAMFGLAAVGMIAVRRRS